MGGWACGHGKPRTRVGIYNSIRDCAGFNALSEGSSDWAVPHVGILDLAPCLWCLQTVHDRVGTQERASELCEVLQETKDIRICSSHFPVQNESLGNGKDLRCERPSLSCTSYTHASHATLFSRGYLKHKHAKKQHGMPLIAVGPFSLVKLCSLGLHRWCSTTPPSSVSQSN